MINQQKIKEEIEKMACSNCNRQPVLDIISKNKYKINACCEEFEDEIVSKLQI